MAARLLMQPVWSGWRARMRSRSSRAGARRPFSKSLTALWKSLWKMPAIGFRTVSGSVVWVIVRGGPLRSLKNRRRHCCRRRALGVVVYRLLAEERQHGARALVGDRQRLDAELLLGLQRLKVGAFGREVGVDQLPDAGGQRVGQALDEVRLRRQLVCRRAQRAQRGLDLADRRFDSVEHTGGLRRTDAAGKADDACYGLRGDGARASADVQVALGVEGRVEAVLAESGVQIGD